MKNQGFYATMCNNLQNIFIVFKKLTMLIKVGIVLRRSLLSLVLMVCLVLAPISTFAAADKPRYTVDVELGNNLVFINEYNPELGYYERTEHVFLASPGVLIGGGRSATPVGTYTLRSLTDNQYSREGTWYRFRRYASCYVNYVTQISGDYLFHSTPHSAPRYNSINMKNVAEMGQFASGGCVRLWPRQSAWIWSNCNGAKVYIYYGEKTEESNRLREELMAEMPTYDEWPNTKVLENTKFLYTYPGDTLESLAELSGKTVEQLALLNPNLDFEALASQIPVGLAVRIKASPLDPDLEAVEVPVEEALPGLDTPIEEGTEVDQPPEEPKEKEATEEPMEEPTFNDPVPPTAVPVYVSKW